MAQTDAERQQHRRERVRRDRAAAEARTQMRALAGRACVCCGQTEPLFLTVADERVLCANCAIPDRLGWLCPHHGISRRLG